MAKTAAQMTANWQAAMQSPTTSQKYKQGIQNFQGNPMALAATPEATALYLANVQASVASGKRQAKLQAAPVDRWRNNAMNIGAMSLTSGATKALDKVTAHFNKWASIYEQASQAARGLPKGGFANAMARVAASMQVMMAAAGRA